MPKKKVKKKSNLKFLWILVGIVGLAVILVAFFVARMLAGDYQTDKHCNKSPTPFAKPSKPLESAKDFFDFGNTNYDNGDCQTAILYYTKALERDPKFAESYNNRAYTLMRMRNYQDALVDLDKAIALRPDYLNARMNRGDIYNYYYAIDRKKALQDYNYVLSHKSDTYESSVCGHRLLAQNNGWNLNVLFTILTNGAQAGCKQ